LSGADPEIEHPIGVADVHVPDRPLDPPPHQPAEGRVVKHRVKVVNLAGACFLHVLEPSRTGSCAPPAARVVARAADCATL